MKRALVTLSTLLGALVLYFVVAFYGAGFWQARRSLSQNLGDHLFMMHSLVLRGVEKKIPPTRAEVEKALERLDPRCHHEVRELARWRLESLADVAAPILVAELDEHAGALATEPEDSERRFRVRAVLRGVMCLKVDAAVPRLLEILESEEDSTLRFELLGAFGEIRDRRALPALLNVFRSPRTYPMKILQKNERSHALEALARLGGEATPVVIEEFYRSSDPNHVRDMCGLLGQTRDARAAEVLVGLVRHPRRDVRDSAANALDLFMGPEAIAPVLAALEKERNDFIRARLISRVLDDADARDERVVTALLSLVDDPAVGDHAVQALGTMGGSDATEAFLTASTAIDPIRVMENLEFTSGFPIFIDEVEGRLQTVELLGAFLRHENPLVRKQALASLVNNGHSSALPAVERLLSDPDAGVRRHARNAAFTLNQSASVEALLRFLPSAEVHRELRSEFHRNYVVGFASDFLDGATAVHRLLLALSFLLALALLFNRVRVFEPYRFTLLSLLLLYEGFLGDFWWSGEAYYMGRLDDDTAALYPIATSAHILLLVGFIVLRPERGPAAIPNRFGRLLGLSLIVMLPVLVYYGAPILSEAFQKAAAAGAYMAIFLALFAFTTLLAVEEFLVPWSLFPRSARSERILTGMLSACLMLLLAYPLSRLARERWLGGDSDGATASLLLLAPLVVMSVVYLARSRPFDRASASAPPPPPTKRLKVRQDGETLSIQLPGSRFLPPDRVQIRDGYVRRSRTVAGAALGGAKWSRRFPPGGRPNLNAAEQAWLRSRLGHDLVASAEALVTGLKLELSREPLSRSACRLQMKLFVANGARRAWSPAGLEQAVGGVAFRAVVNGREADVSFSQKERETAMPPGSAAHLRPRVYLAEPVAVDCTLEVSIVCRAGEISVASPPVVFAS